jgi:signal transduction histidine kinase
LANPDLSLTHTAQFPASRSLRVRLPLLISALIACSLLIFLLLSRAQIQTALMRSGEARAQSVADQLGNLLAQGQQQRLTELRRIGRDPAVMEYLHHPDTADASKAKARLATLTTAAQPPVELWDTAGHRLLVAEGGGARPAKMPPALPAERPTAAGTGAFTAQGETLYWATTVDVTPDPVDGARSATLGFIVSRRLLTGNSAQSDAIAKLIGQGSLLRLGEPGGVWTDLSRKVAAPSGAVKPGPIADSAGPDGRQYIGAAVPVRATPWLVLVEFPRDEVIAPAWAFLVRMLGVGLIFVLVAAAVTHYVSARITTPLGIVTRAAEQIAQGEVEQRVEPGRRDELGRLAIAFNSMADQVQSHRLDLESRVEERTKEVTALNTQLEQRVAELDALTSELEAFSYSVSHDLRAPVRHITGFAALLERSVNGSLSDQSHRYLRTIADSATRMGRLIDDLLVFSRMGRSEMMMTHVDLNTLVERARGEVESQNPGRAIAWDVRPLPVIEGDPAMLHQVMVNLLANAVKYTGTRDKAAIEVGATRAGNETVLHVRDNGVGFDMQYAGKLFGVFQRLHGSDEFEGTGIGLANVRRIVNRHHGRTWAEGAVDGGATFYVALPSLN